MRLPKEDRHLIPFWFVVVISVIWMLFWLLVNAVAYPFILLYRWTRSRFLKKGRGGKVVR
jgi:hypothetical protein